MDLPEYQGKELFGRYGIRVPGGRLARSPAEAEQAAAELGGAVALKAQVLRGGRGKAGGVRLAATPAEANAAAAAILGLALGETLVDLIWVEPVCEIAHEHYLAVALDRSAHGIVLIFSAQGGVEIEQIAAERPHALARVHVDPLEGLMPHHLRELLGALADPGERSAVAAVARDLYRCFVEADATLCEINPLVITTAGEAVALDAKVTIDDSALYRQPGFASLRPVPGRETLEGFAAEKKVTYVKLDGTVGILGNGAGLSMSTVDIVVVAGGTPANFCDLGGGGSADGVVASLEVIGRDPQVRSILCNVFGGITRCDEVARGIVTALDRLELAAPIVVRLDGTNAEEGRQILADSPRAGLFVESTMLAAAHRAVELAR
jgi:succinyl-CoA synthetase beta subunit